MRVLGSWSLRGLLLAALATSAALPGRADEGTPAPASPAGPARAGLAVATQFRAYAGFQPRPDDPLDRLPAGRAVTFELGPAASAGLVKGLARNDGAFGRVRWARRDVLVGLYAPEGSSLRLPLLCVDQDGDGTFEAPGEQRRVAVHGSERGQRWGAEFTLDGVPAVLEVERTARVRRLVRLQGGARRVLPLEAPPPGGVLLPGGGKADLLARVRLAGRDVLVGVAFLTDATGGLAASVHVDLDGDRRLDLAREALGAEPVAAAPGEVAWRARTEVLGEELVLQAEERGARVEGTLASPGALRGTVNVGGRTLALYLLDGDLDGAFDAADDLWWLGPVERLARVHDLNAETMSAGDDPIFVGGTAWRVGLVEADGTAHLAADPAAQPGEVLARRHERSRLAWAARLQAEAEPLRAANGIDPAREHLRGLEALQPCRAARVARAARRAVQRAAVGIQQQQQRQSAAGH
ncbi:MAG: hypothetical protein ACKOSS_07700, partial [Planctomycetia bacterium]